MRRSHVAVIAAAVLAGMMGGAGTRVFGRPQSHVAGHPKNGVQFMVKDQARYAATGAWGFAQFDDGKPSTAGPAACFACHTLVRDRDLVFNRYAP
jgi:hypothetical protein